MSGSNRGMIQGRMRRSCQLLALGLLTVLIGCGPTTAVVRQPVGTPETGVHLIVDLGSSGTRFCLYDVRPAHDSKRCELSSARPVCSRVKGGLARITRGLRSRDVAGRIRQQLRTAWRLLSEPAVGGDPALRSRVHTAAALGTGGFRDAVTGKPLRLPEWQALFAEVERFLKHEAGLSKVTARPITGEEEGRLAWLGLSQEMARPDEFATIEAGGATIQLAVGRTGAHPAAIQVATDSLGQDIVFERFVPSSGPITSGFEVCHSPTNPRHQDGLRCIEFLQEHVFRDSAVRRLAEATPTRRLFGLGLSFGDLFRGYPAGPPWTTKLDRAMHEKLKFDNIKQLTALMCPMTDSEIAAYAPKALAIEMDPSLGRSTGRACFYLAYRAALLAAVRHVAADAELFSADEDQWPRGAAVAGDLFPSCR